VGIFGVSLHLIFDVSRSSSTKMSASESCFRPYILIATVDTSILDTKVNFHKPLYIWPLTAVFYSDIWPQTVSVYHI